MESSERSRFSHVLKAREKAMPPWISYKNYEIQSVTTPLASGQWQVEVRVFFHDGRRVANQGRLMPDYYATEEEAYQAGKAYGRKWVDALVASEPPCTDPGEP